MNDTTLKLKNIGFSIVFLLASQMAQGAIDEMDDFFAMSPEELANISVTIATGTAKPAYQSAAITTVITAEQIKAMGATELPQVLETVPGLHISIQEVTNDPVYSMRGMRNDVNAQVLLMLNGTRFSVPYKGSSMTAMTLPVEAIQKIEVIRGPGSALYGADAFAGVINIITKKAKDIEETEIGIRGGSWDAQSIWGLHSEQWLGWDIATTLQYSHNNNDGDRIIDSDLQTQFDSAMGSNASLAPGEMQTQAENWNAHLNLQRKHWDVGFWAYNKVDAGMRAGAGGALDDEGNVNAENYLTDIRFSSEDNIENWQLLAHASYLYTNVDADLHNFPDGTVLPIDSNGNINSTSVALVSFPDGVNSYIGIENQVASIELSAIFKGFEDHLLRFSTGYRYEQVVTKESRNFGSGIIDGTQAIVDGNLTNVTGTDLVFLPDSHRSIWSVALQDEWQISQNWMFTGGVRYDHYSDFGSTVNPRLALVWNINEKLTSKILYGRAFRAPSFLEQKQQNSQLFIGNPDLEPEIINTIEIAFDYRPYRKLRLVSNFYFYEIEDSIAAVIESGVATVGKGDDQVAYGAEFEWDWKIHQQLSLRGNYAWQYAINERTTQRISGVPEHQVYVAVAWAFLPQWKLQTQFNWIGHRLNLENSTNQTLKDYETVDVTLNSPRFFKHINFSASVRNVFNSNGKVPASNSYVNNLPIASRSFYLQTTVHF
ncbi:MAG: TonB-dependent receptor [Methylococcales bacterium]|nr:TonB-dependent receptor [Methylococcales bacterium]